MRRPFTTCAPMFLMAALAPAALFAQATPPAQTPPPATAPAAQTPPAQPAGAPKLGFTTDAGLLLVQIKGDQTAVFEELIAKLRTGGAKVEDATVKQQLTNLKVYKTSEGAAGGNALYVILLDPAAKDAEYELFAIAQKVMTPDELRAPETVEFFKKAAAAFAAGYNKLSLTPVK
jgi:hypothetical protein